MEGETISTEQQYKGQERGKTWINRQTHNHHRDKPKKNRRNKER